MRTKDNILIPDTISGPKVTWRDKVEHLCSRIPFWVPVTIALVVILTVFVVRNAKHISTVSGEAVLTRELLSEELAMLEGLYSVTSFEDGQVYSTAEVSLDGDMCSIVIYSDFSPMNIEATRLSDGSLYCDTLGEGRITYKPSTGSVRIKFTKGGKDICEFLK